VIGALNDIDLRGYKGLIDPDLKIFLDSKDFFRFGGREVYPANRESKLYRVFVTALKIASLFTILVPLVVYVRGQMAKNRLTAKEDDITRLIKMRTQQRIQSADSRYQPYNQTLAGNPNDLDQIIFGLFLGNGKSFLDCSGFQISDHNECGQPTGLRDTSNPSKIQGIITMCPLTDLAKEGGDAETLLKPENLENGEPKLRAHFKKKNIDWLYPGRTISDMSSGRMGIAEETDASRLVKWTTFIFNTTHPHDPNTTFEPAGSNQEALVRSNIEKNAFDW